MTPDELLALADSPELISGIYNYCDRWCERCPMTSRCLLFISMEAEDEDDANMPDINQEAFWNKIHNSFSLAFGLLEKFAKENDINLEVSPEEEEAFAKEHEARISTAKNSPVTQLAESYMKLGKAWLDHCHESLVKKDAELQQAIQLGLPGRQPQQEASVIQDAIEVISYYLFQICVKMMRALSGRQEDDELEEEGEVFPKDSDGSAKVALIGINNSIKAWETLLTHFQEQEEAILEILAVLERLVRMIESELPGARPFVRPGFDD